MPTNLRDLTAKFTLLTNTDALEKLDKGLDAIKRRIDAFIGYEVVKGIAELAEKFAKMGQDLKVTAESLGLGVEEFQKLSFAASQSSVSQEQLSHSMMRLSRALFDARNGSIEAQEIFARLGVPPGQIANVRNADQALMMLSTRLTGMTDPIAKLALVQKTLGRGSMEMVAFLSQGPGAIQARMQAAARDGLILSEAQVNGLEKMNHAFERLEAKLKVILGSVVEPLAPVIERLVNDFIRLFNVNKDWIQLNFDAFVGKVAYALGFLDGLVSTFISRLAKNLPKTGILGAIFGDFIIGGGLLLILSGIVAGISAITAAAASLAATLLPIIAAIQVIHDLAIIALGPGSISDRLKQTWTAKELDWLTEKGDALAQGYAASGSDSFLNNIATQTTLSAMAAAGRGGASINAPTSMTFNINGGDALSIARTIRSEIDKHHGQKMRETYRSVQGNKVGSD